MENGRILADDDPKKGGPASLHPKERYVHRYACPGAHFLRRRRAGRRFSPDGAGGPQLADGKGRRKKAARHPAPQPEFPEEIRDPALEVKEIWFRYEKDSPDILKGVSFRVPKGTLFSIVGGNGTGKSTTLKAVCGICRPYRGKVRVDGQDTAKCRDLFHGKLAMLPQDPQCLFVKKTVREDLEEMLPRLLPG